MLDEKDRQTYIKAFAYVKRSKNREQIIKIIANSHKIPSDIANTMNARFSLVSAILADLKSKNIVVCLNEEDKTGRLYELTELGLKIHEELEQE